MVIDPSSPLNVSIQSGKTRAQTAAQPASESTHNKPTAPETNDVSLSSTGKSLVQLESSIQSASGIDIDKVNTLKASIDAGNYAIDSNAIADKIAL